LNGAGGVKDEARDGKQAILAYILYSGTVVWVHAQIWQGCCRGGGSSSGTVVMVMVVV